MKQFLSLLLSAAFTLAPCAAIGEENASLGCEVIPIAETDAAALAQLGIMRGTDLGMELEREVNRAEAVVLLNRLIPAVGDGGEENTLPFADMTDNRSWAQGAVLRFWKNGWINGVSATEFAPERTVTGTEFTKMLLSALGYSGVTLENAYDIAAAADLLSDNFTKSAVHENLPLLRSDCARLCYSALTAKTADGEQLYKTLIASGAFDTAAITRIIGGSVCPMLTEDSFADMLSAAMPQTENYMVSPLSVTMALAMTANGAAGDTQSEILKACGISNLADYNKSAKKLIEEYAAADLIQLSIANSIWLNESKTPQSFQPAFEDVVKTYYKGTSQRVTDQNAVRLANAWVAEKTNNKITSIVDQPEFAALLLNAVYFKGKWQTEFNEKATAPDVFCERGGTQKTIDFMHRTGYMNYAAAGDVQIVELPYRSSSQTFDEKGNVTKSESVPFEVSMYVLLGDGRVAHPERLIRSTPLHTERVALMLPKFTFSFKTSLTQVLSDMGMQTPFSAEKADFSPMLSGTNPMGNTRLLDVVHKTYIDVNERETEAAAVTGVLAGAISMPAEPIPFRADRPFTFVIYDKTNDVTLFTGEYAFAE